MGKQPVTQALRQLNAAGIGYESYTYRYEAKGGAEHAARELDVPLHQMIKTIVMSDDQGGYCIVLMHGDRDISAKQLARRLAVRKVSPADPRMARNLTGYQVGGTSPFGVKTPLKVYVEESIFDLDYIYINGGSRGLIIRIPSQVLKEELAVETINAAISRQN